MSRELVIPERPSPLPAIDAGANHIGWLIAYCHRDDATTGTLDTGKPHRLAHRLSPRRGGRSTQGDPPGEKSR